MLRKLPSLKPRKFISILIANGCYFYREGKGDHTLYCREFGNIKKVVPIDIGKNEYSPIYVLRVLRQFGFTDEEINEMKF